ncbi:hypothetical protein [uncultured Brachyspira sp.]|uniref:hypothetical protein n=1 Tax=uncultured Brachyspira sp. TaxID=221953 RepID=UPI0025D927A8|nr:hypothetical protein [uncultured Brachyspira sp.]
MKKFLLILSIISVAAISCADKSSTSGKPVSTIAPSANSDVKEGTPIAQWDGKNNISASLSGAVAAQAGETTAPTYSLLDRLYTTTWYQSEDDYDDGVVENETTFIFFDNDSKIREVEYENGIQDDPAEYSAVSESSPVGTTAMAGVENSTWNAMVVKTTELGERDTDWSLLYLKDRDVLYVIELDNANNLDSAKKVATTIVNSIETNTAGTVYNDDKFILSVVK